MRERERQNGIPQQRWKASSELDIRSILSLFPCVLLVRCDCLSLSHTWGKEQKIVCTRKQEVGSYLAGCLPQVRNNFKEEDVKDVSTVKMWNGQESSLTYVSTLWWIHGRKPIAWICACIYEVSLKGCDYLKALRSMLFNIRLKKNLWY